MGSGQADLANWTRTWLAEVQRLTGKAPMIYTGYYFWRDSVGNPTDIGANYRLWLPELPRRPEQHDVPAARARRVEHVDLLAVHEHRLACPGISGQRRRQPLLL